MGCICKCHEKCKNKYMKKEDQAQKDFEKVKKEINESMINIHETLEGIKDWDSFFHSNEKIWLDDEKIKLNKIDIDSPKYNKISYLKLLSSYNCEKMMESRCVLIFAYIVLTIIIGATSIIGLKEFMNIYKNFYKKRFNISQILCSHYCLIFIVTKIYSCCKKKNKMMEHSQTIILDTNPEEKDKKKDKNNKINEIEDKSSEDIVLNNFYKETKNLEESDKNLEQFIFIFFSSLTCLGIIGINAAIFKSFKNISTKSIFSPILIVYVSSFILSLILYFFILFQK